MTSTTRKSSNIIPLNEINGFLDEVYKDYNRFTSSSSSSSSSTIDKRFLTKLSKVSTIDNSQKSQRSGSASDSNPFSSSSRNENSVVVNRNQSDELRKSSRLKSDGKKDSTVHGDDHYEKGFDEIVFDHLRTRPLVTLTFAQSLDGKIAGPDGQQLRLSGNQSMKMTHLLRTRHDGILVGLGTLINDDPQLTARNLSFQIPLESQPQPIVLDSFLKAPSDCKLIKNFKNGLGKQPWLICGRSTMSLQDKHRLESAGARVIPITNAVNSHKQGAGGGGGIGLNLEKVFEVCKLNGIDRLMIEGGSRVISSCLNQNHKYSNLPTTTTATVPNSATGANPNSLLSPNSLNQTNHPNNFNGKSGNDPGSGVVGAGRSTTENPLIDIMIVTVSPYMVGEGISINTCNPDSLSLLRHTQTKIMGSDSVFAYTTNSNFQT